MTTAAGILLGALWLASDQAAAPEPPVGQPGLRLVAGQSAVVGGNAAGARERALDEALRQAVSQALAEMLDPQTRAAQAKGLRALEARARSYVRGYRTLEEGETNGNYAVRLEAEVDEPALRRAVERLGTTPTTSGTPAAAAARPGVLLVATGTPGVGATVTSALATALSGTGARAQVGEAADPAAALAAAARAQLTQVAFLTTQVVDEGGVRGTGKVAVSCRVSARVVATASGLPVAERAAAPRAFADSPEAARGDCLARAASELAPQLVPATGGAATTGGDLRTVIVDADVVEPAAVAALLKTIRSVGAVSSAELRRVTPGRAEIRVRTRTLAPALAPALSRDGGAMITLSGVEASGDLIRLRVRLRQNPTPTPAPAGATP